MIDFHFGLGMWIRNNWLYTGERENVESLLKDLGEPEFLIGDMTSSAILDAYQNTFKRKNVICSLCLNTYIVPLQKNRVRQAGHRNARIEGARPASF